MKKLIIIGNGGHSKVVQSIIKKTNEYKITEIWDDEYQKSEIYEGILHRRISTQIASDTEIHYFVAIGDNSLRRHIVKMLDIPFRCYATIIHPDAIVDERAVISPGSLVMANAVIQTNSNIGDFCIINTSSVIDHDSSVGGFSHIGPNATITGGCDIGNNVFMGASSVVIPNISIGDNVIVGAGSVVVCPIPDSVKAYGNPARIKYR